MFSTHDAIDPASLARLVEERGYTGLMFPEHTHIPSRRSTPRPSGGELPPRYAKTFDLFVALAAAATATTRLRIGSSVCLVVERDPIITAKEVASVDVLSGGRFDFGIGAGWNHEEMANHGTDPQRRMAVMRERVEAMKVIWTSAIASYHGEFVDFDEIWSWPKPLQRPHVPVLVGGNGPTVANRVLAYGDGWFPTYTAAEDALLAERGAELRQTAGRSIDLKIIGLPGEPKLFEQFDRAGFSRIVMWLPSAHRSVVEAKLDEYDLAIADFNGE